jgi:hypothetical protein
MTLRIDEDRWPIAKLIFTDKNGTDEMQSAIRCYQRLFLRSQRFAVISDARTAPPPALSDMRVFSAFCKQYEADFKRLCAGVAFVLPGGVLMRMAIRTLMQLVDPPFPRHVCTEVTEAEQWCREQLNL